MLISPRRCQIMTPAETLGDIYENHRRRTGRNKKDGGRRIP